MRSHFQTVNALLLNEWISFGSLFERDFPPLLVLVTSKENAYATGRKILSCRLDGWNFVPSQKRWNTNPSIWIKILKNFVGSSQKCIWFERCVIFLRTIAIMNVFGLLLNLDFSMEQWQPRSFSFGGKLIGVCSGPFFSCKKWFDEEFNER